MTDAEIVQTLATRVMGWPVVMFYDYDRKGGVFPRLVHQHPPEDEKYFLITGDRNTEGNFDPLTSISDEFMVVEKMRANLWQMDIELGPIGGREWVRFYRDSTRRSDNDWIYIDEPLTRAICLAAISATTEPKE